MSIHELNRLADHAQSAIAAALTALADSDAATQYAAAAAYSATNATRRYTAALQEYDAARTVDAVQP